MKVEPFRKMRTEKEMQGVGYNLLSAFPSNFLMPNCLVHPLSLASGALGGDHLRAWAVRDRWADDGSDVIDSGVMDGWLADRGLMQGRGHCSTADGLVIDR